MAINDFGEKIGGAKKDMWKDRELSSSDLYFLDIEDCKEYVNKKNVWKIPDYQQMLDNGYDKTFLYYIKKVRDSLPSSPQFSYKDNTDELKKERIKSYVENMKEIRDELMIYNRYLDIDFLEYRDFVYKDYSNRYNITEKGASIINNKFFTFLQKDVWEFQFNKDYKKFLSSKEELETKKYRVYEIKESMLPNLYDNNNSKFYLKINTICSTEYIYPRKPELCNDDLYRIGTYVIIKGSDIVQANLDSLDKANEEIKKIVDKTFEEKKEKTKTEKKETYKPLQLKDIEITDHREGKNVSGQNYLDEFNFKGGEFGNYLNENDRQFSLNYGYDSFIDLANALDIKENNIGLEETLSIAFGSRGSGNTLAHYETARKVINLTKMKGAGSLAHEYGHALDHFLGIKLGKDTYLSKSYSQPVWFSNLIKTMKEKENGEMTDFYKNACKLNSSYAKAGKGYWNSDIEMFARAFAVYIKDKLNYRNDYLVGHADENPLMAPQGEERTKINKAFDEMFDKIKELGFLEKKTQSLDDLIKTADSYIPEDNMGYNDRSRQR